MEMTRESEDEIYAQAWSWHERIDRPDMDWDGFAAWLDSAPEHQAIYDRLALLDADVRLVRDEIHAALPANDPPSAATHDTEVEASPPRKAWRYWAVGGVAAALIGAVVLPSLMPPRVSTTAYATGPGETRLVSLKDGSTVRLDRNTRVAIAYGQGPVVRLDAGAAYFDVRHDPGRSFIVSSGDFAVRDLGTSFSVSRYAMQTSVAVAQGLVEVQYRNKVVRSLAAGQQMDSGGPDENLTVRRVDPTSIASWRDGRLVYDNAPLALIVKDMSRYARRPVSVDPSIANLTFSGVLVIGDGSHLVDQLQSLLPVKARDMGNDIKLVGVGKRG